MHAAAFATARVAGRAALIFLVAACTSVASNETRPSPANLGADDAGLPKGAVSFALVKARPEAGLYYAGSQVVRPFGGGEAGAPDGKSAAFAGAILVTTARSTDIYGWYRSELNGRGWAGPKAIGGAVQWTSAVEYTRGAREILYVSIDDPKLVGGILGGTVPQSGTLYELRYTIQPYN